MKEITDSLIRMGYRELYKGKYAKPVACNLFTFEIDKMLWTNWFKRTKEKDQLLIWNSEEFTEKDKEWKDHTLEEAFLAWLKMTEGLTRLDYNGNTYSNFEFNTPEEMYNKIL